MPPSEKKIPSAEKSSPPDKIAARWPSYLRCHAAIGLYKTKMEEGAEASYLAGVELHTMLSKQLYLVQYQSFGDYVETEWDWSEAWAHLLIKMMRVYTREEARNSGLFTSHLVMLAAADLDEKVRKAIEQMVCQMRASTRALEEALQKVRAAKAAGRSAEEQKQAARERLLKARELKEKRAQERAKHGAGAAKWIEDAPQGLPWPEFQAYQEVRGSAKKLYTSTRGFLRNLSEVNQALCAAPVVFTGPQPMGLWEMLFGLRGALPGILAEYQAHLPEAERQKALAQAAADPEVMQAIREREQVAEEDEEYEEYRVEEGAAAPLATWVGVAAEGAGTAWMKEGKAEGHGEAADVPAEGAGLDADANTRPNCRSP